MTTAEKRKEQPLNQKSSSKLPALKPVVLLAAGALALTMAASIWIYVQGTHELRAQAKAQGIYLYVEGANASHGDPKVETPATVDAKVPRLLKQVDDWALRVTMATAAGGAGLMLATILGISWWRHAWLSLIARTSKEWQEDARKVEQVGRGWLPGHGFSRATERNLELAQKSRLGRGGLDGLFLYRCGPGIHAGADAPFSDRKIAPAGAWRS